MTLPFGICGVEAGTQIDLSCNNQRIFPPSKACYIQHTVCTAKKTLEYLWRRGFLNLYLNNSGSQNIQYWGFFLCNCLFHACLQMPSDTLSGENLVMPKLLMNLFSRVQGSSIQIWLRIRSTSEITWASAGKRVVFSRAWSHSTSNCWKTSRGMPLPLKCCSTAS